MKFWSEDHRRNYHNRAARETFARLIAEGHDGEEIIAAARTYTIEAISSGATPLPFEAWLAAKPWEHRRN